MVAVCIALTPCILTWGAMAECSTRCAFWIDGATQTADSHPRMRHGENIGVNTMKHAKRRVPKCPKCACSSLFINEEWTLGCIDWMQRDNKLILAPFHDDGGGDPVRVTAQCASCGHMWTLRNCPMITSHPLYTEDSKYEEFI